ncbi:hypothetical protein N9C48_00700 [bacterium]|nr:hypothetical protein [bacterium]MDA9938610.1 hypothetical protein [bacterium]
MDFHKLQQKLFQIEPTDRAADRAAMVASMQGANPQESVQVEENFLQESVDVPQGTMPVEGNYSVSDFAKLAGVTLNEGKQKHGSAGQLKGKDAFTKSSKPGGNESPHPARGKLVGEKTDDAPDSASDAFKRGYKNYNSPSAFGIGASDIAKKADKAFGGKNSKPDTGKTTAFDQGIQKILKDPALKKELLLLMKKANSKSQMNSEAQKNRRPQKPKPRNTGYKDLEALRTSGAGGAHTDKSKTIPRKQKYKQDPTQESIKEMLFRKLNEKSS